MFKKIILFVFIVSLSTVSCSRYNKLLKSRDVEKKYEMAIKYYEKGDYFRATQLFDELTVLFRGTARAEKVYYYYAYCYFHQKDYILASYHFNYFAKTFPRSQYAEECLFMAAYCKYKDSPIYSLDQTSTVEAIKELQLFANLYPNSTRIKQVNELIDELRFKLETKAFEIAKLYFQTESYKASISAFTTFLKDYPASAYKEEAMYIMAKAAYKYALLSIPSKQKQRFEAALESFKAIEVAFPQSKYKKEIISFNKLINKELAKYSN